MFDSNLRAERARRDLTQQELATKAGLSKLSILNYESGRSKPGTKALTSLADALGMTTDELLGRGDK